MSDKSLDLDIGVKIVCIESSDEDNFEIGSGFVFYQDSDFNYILTCAHVIKAVGGESQVLVDGYQAAIIEQSSDNSADDLAILVTKKTETYPILPLASYIPFSDSKLLDLNFKTKGFYLENRNEMTAGTLKGTLSQLQEKRAKYQHNSTKVWKLKLDDECLLESGYSGSPVVNKVYRVICGVVSDKKGEGREGFARSIETLENFWPESNKFLRESIYDLDKIVKLLNSIFRNKESQFLDFCNQHFPEYFDNKLSLYPQIAYLVLCCHHFNKINDLLEHISQSNSKLYSQYIASICIRQSVLQDTFYYKETNKSICEFLRATFSLQGTNNKDNCEAEIIYKYDDRENLGLQKSTFNQIQMLAIESFATATSIVLNLSRTQIQILDAGTGSIKLRLKLPSNSLDKLISIYQTDRSLANNLSIQYINEILVQPFEIDKINKLINRIFYLQEIIELCIENFPTFYEEEHKLLKPTSLSIVKKSKILESLFIFRKKKIVVDKLILYLSNNLRIDEILELAQEKNRKAYNKYRPYIRVPRRSNRIQNFSNSLTRWEIIKAFSSGFVVSFLFNSLIWLSLYIPDDIGLISTITFLFLPFIGSMVGEVVSKKLNNRKGENIGKLAVFAFVIGFLFSRTTLDRVMYVLAFDLAEGNIINTITSTIITLPFFLIIGSIFLVINFLLSFSMNPTFLINMIFQAGIFGFSCRIAYERAR